MLVRRRSGLGRVLPPDRRYGVTAERTIAGIRRLRAERFHRYPMLRENRVSKSAPNRLNEWELDFRACGLRLRSRREGAENNGHERVEWGRNHGLNRSPQSAGLRAGAREHAGIGKKIPTGELVGIFNWWWKTEPNPRSLSEADSNRTRKCPCFRAIVLFPSRALSTEGRRGLGWRARKQ